MNKSNDRVWPEETIQTENLVLDSENARIDLKRSATQSEIRAALVESEDIIKLATSISRHGGRMAGERIVVIKNANSYVVVEGNRRVCACQLLLKPDLAPKGYAIPAIDSQTRNAIAELKADIAPSRDEADIIVTRRHTESGIKMWSTLANIRRFERMRKAGKSDDEIARSADISPGRIRKLGRAAAALDLVLALPCWSAEEKRRLSNPRLKTTAFTRFFELSGVADKLDLSYTSNNKLKSGLTKATFDAALEYLAKQLLLPDPLSGKPRLNTRAEPDKVFAEMAKANSVLSVLAPAKSKSGGAKPYSFFEQLACPIPDARCRVIANEISTINYRIYRNAAAFLLRALLESALHHALKHAKLEAQFMAAYHTKYKNAAGKAPGLEFLIEFCEKNWVSIFQVNPSRAFAVWRGQKIWSDLVIHGKWMSATTPALEAAAGATRGFIADLLSGSALK